jgi:hypothetical protein
VRGTVRQNFAIQKLTLVEKVRFWMLYQPLTSIGPAPGKENESQAGRENGCPPLTDSQADHVGRLTAT